MLKAAIFSVLLVLAGAYATWYQQDYCSALENSEQKPEPNRAKNGIGETANANQGPVQKPLIASGRRSTFNINAPLVYNESSNQLPETPKKNWRETFYCEAKATDVTLSWFTLLLFAATVGLIWIAFRQEQSSRRTERAYLLPILRSRDTHIITADNETRAAWQFDLIYRNSGKTPAIIRLLRGYSQILPSTERAPNSLIDTGRRRELPESIFIAPGSEFIDTISIRIDAAEWAQIDGLHLVLYLMGLVEYDDIFTIRRATGYCWQYVWHMNEGRFIPTRGTSLNFYK